MIKCFGLPPFRRLRGSARPQFEIAGVKERAVISLKEKLCGAKDVAGRQQHDFHAAHRSCVRRRAATCSLRLPGIRASHQTRCSFRDDDLVVRRDMIAVRVRDKGEAVLHPRGRATDSVAADKRPRSITNFDHVKIYAAELSKRNRVSASRDHPERVAPDMISLSEIPRLHPE